MNLLSKAISKRRHLLSMQRNSCRRQPCKQPWEACSYIFWLLHCCNACQKHLGEGWEGPIANSVLPDRSAMKSSYRHLKSNRCKPGWHCHRVLEGRRCACQLCSQLLLGLTSPRWLGRAAAATTTTSALHGQNWTQDTRLSLRCSVHTQSAGLGGERWSIECSPQSRNTMCQGVVRHMVRIWTTRSDENDDVNGCLRCKADRHADLICLPAQWFGFGRQSLNALLRSSHCPETASGMVPDQSGE